jgi:hypothetical protein
MLGRIRRLFRRLARVRAALACGRLAEIPVMAGAGGSAWMLFGLVTTCDRDFGASLVRPMRGGIPLTASRLCTWSTAARARGEDEDA